MNEYIEMWKHFADFSGTTSVKGYWMAFLINFLVSAVIFMLAQYVSFLGSVVSLYSLAVLIPSLSIMVRRLRDAGKGWANVFWMFLPVVGWIILLVQLCKKTAV